MIQPFIHNQPYAAFACPLDHRHGPRDSYAYWCRKCGEVWARFVNPGHPWHFIRIDCTHCPPDSPNIYLPGSVLLSWDSQLYLALPPDILRREVLLLADHVRKFPQFRL